jgi:signal transduction histidine kinase
LDIKLKNKYLYRIALVLAVYLTALSCMLTFDIINHKDFITKDSYFKNYKFKNEISAFFENVKAYHFIYKDYDRKTPLEKISAEELNSIKNQYEPILNQKLFEIDQQYSVDIKNASSAGNKEMVNLLIEEKNKKLTEAKNENSALIDKSVKEQIEMKDNDYRNIKESLENNKFLKYYIVHIGSGEINTNLTDVPNIEKYIESETFYSIKFPLESSEGEQLSHIDSFFKSNNLNGFFMVPKNTNGYNQMIASFNYYNSIRERIFKEIIMLIFTITAAVSILVYLKRVNKLNLTIANTFTRIIRRIPLDLRMFIYLITFIAGLNYLAHTSLFYFPLGLGHIVKLSFAALFTSYIMLIFWELFILIKDKDEFENQWKSSFTYKFIELLRESFLYKNILIKILVFVMATILFGMFMIITLIGYESNHEELILLSFAYIFLYLLIIPYKVLKKTITLSKIMKGTEEIVSGNLSYVIEETGKGNIAKLAHNINNMKQGFKSSLESQMKSERMKSELITNVSHDLKTPLTSIINYVDLLKRNELTQEEIKDYVGVLDRKAQRLKTLIEDLFEASKMSSGSVELNIEKVDVTSLLNQALAEFEEKINNSSLSFKINIPKHKIFAELDGKKIWRVFENLINNALKYSQPNTRVYIDLAEHDNKVLLIIKNIASYEMDFDVNEIFERFKRGDKSRHTEGSGLGLAIAKSIVELHGGELNIEIDGDLFKAIVKFNK